MVLAYIVTTEIQLDFSTHDPKTDVHHFQAFPGTMYIPSLGVQLVRTGSENVLELNLFDLFPNCSLRQELTAILEHAPEDSIRRIDVNGADVESILRSYHEFGRSLYITSNYLYTIAKQ